MCDCQKQEGRIRHVPDDPHRRLSTAFARAAFIACSEALLLPMATMAERHSSLHVAFLSHTAGSPQNPESEDGELNLIGLFRNE